MRPKKSLGQCFLINKGAAQRIAALLGIEPNDTVLEIGGGRGELTTFLVIPEARVYTVEIDSELTASLRHRFADQQNLSVIEDDILKVNPSQLDLKTNTLKLVGNIPYHLSSAIVKWLIKWRRIFPLAVITVQKEVADRLTAAPGGKQFGSLTIFLQIFYSARKVFDLKPGSFYPPPKVTSSVLCLKRLSESLVSDAEFADLRRLTRCCFGWRRKQILHILKEEYRLAPEVLETILGELSIESTSRPEQLAVTDFVALSRKLVCAISESSQL